jgi:hypothetical protein
MKHLNNQFLSLYLFVKHCLFRYKIAFVVGVTINKLYQSQSDAVRRINECTLLMMLERFSVEEGRSLIRGFMCEIFSSYRNLTVTERAIG